MLMSYKKFKRNGQDNLGSLKLDAQKKSSIASKAHLLQNLSLLWTLYQATHWWKEGRISLLLQLTTEQLVFWSTKDKGKREVHEQRKRQTTISKYYQNQCNGC